jgi:hypothetical protein
MFDWRNPPEDAPMVWHSTVSSNFFELLGTAPAAGRTFSAEDAANAERVAVIAHSVWTSVFGAAPDIAGRMVTMGGLPYQIIGVMPAEFDFPTRRTGVWTPIEIDPSWPANRARRDQALVNAVARLRPGTTVAAAQTERMALGARSWEVLGMVLRQGLALTAAGVAVGLAAALWVTKAISALLFGVKPHDPVVLACVAGVLFLVALAASYVPARRATRVDPMTALRCD